MPVNDEVRKAVEECAAQGCESAAETIRAELTRLYAIADSVDPLVVRLHDVTTRLEAAEKDAQFLRSHRPIARKLEAADALLEIIRTGRDGKKYDYVEARDGHMVLVADYLSEPRT